MMENDDAGRTGPNMTTEDVLRVAAALRAYAEHFVQSDWDYTRLHEIEHIRMKNDRSGYNHPLRRLARTVPRLLDFARPNPTKGDGLLSLFISERDLGLRSRLAWAWATLHVGLRSDKNLPDGVLDGGGIITHWEETGEYLQFVQPSVGSKIADLLEAEPESPHARAIAAEMDRISRRYAARCRAGKVDGHVRR